MSRDDSDEVYVISLCDEILDLVAIRQHKFDFLVGDVGKNGLRRRLPVDAYYPSLKLVVKYREKQYAFNRSTLSGEWRGE